MGILSSKRSSKSDAFALADGMIRLFIIGLRPSPSNPNQEFSKDLNGNIISVNNEAKVCWISCDPRTSISGLKKSLMLEFSLNNTSTSDILLIYNHLILNSKCDNYGLDEYGIENNSCLFIAMSADINNNSSYDDNEQQLLLEFSEFQLKMIDSHPSSSKLQEFVVNKITDLDVLMFEQNTNCVQMPECAHGMTVEGLYNYSLVQFNGQEKLITCPHLITPQTVKEAQAISEMISIMENAETTTTAVVEEEAPAPETEVVLDAAEEVVAVEEAVATEEVFAEAELEAGANVGNVEVQEENAAVIDVNHEINIESESKEATNADGAGAEAGSAPTLLQGNQERICGQVWHYMYIRKILMSTIMKKYHNNKSVETPPATVGRRKSFLRFKSSSTEEDAKVKESTLLERNSRDSISLGSVGTNNSSISINSSNNEQQFTLDDILKLDLVCVKNAASADYELRKCTKCSSFLHRHKQRKWKNKKKNDDSSAIEEPGTGGGNEVKADDASDSSSSSTDGDPQPAGKTLNLSFLLDMSPEERLAELRVECQVCNKCVFCWYCGQDWKTEDKSSTGGSAEQPVANCANNDCPSHCFEAQALQILAECDFKKIGKVENVPSIRSCPKCAQLITHSEACKHMKCTMCKCKFCFVCLSVHNGKWSCGSSGTVCPAAERQSKEIFEKKVEEVPPPVPK